MTMSWTFNLRTYTSYRWQFCVLTGLLALTWMRTHNWELMMVIICCPSPDSNILILTLGILHILKLLLDPLFLCQVELPFSLFLFFFLTVLLINLSLQSLSYGLLAIFLLLWENSFLVSTLENGSSRLQFKVQTPLHYFTSCHYLWEIHLRSHCIVLHGIRIMSIWRIESRRTLLLLNVLSIVPDDWLIFLQFCREILVRAEKLLILTWKTLVLNYWASIHSRLPREESSDIRDCTGTNIRITLSCQRPSSSRRHALIFSLPNFIPFLNLPLKLILVKLSLLLLILSILLHRLDVVWSNYLMRMDVIGVLFELVSFLEDLRLLLRWSISFEKVFLFLNWWRNYNVLINLINYYHWKLHFAVFKSLEFLPKTAYSREPTLHIRVHD